VAYPRGSCLPPKIFEPCSRCGSNFFVGGQDPPGYANGIKSYQYKVIIKKLISPYSLPCYILLSFFGVTFSNKLNCKYDYFEFRAVGKIYYCWVQNNLGIISSETSQIDSEQGSHDSGKNNNDVKGFWSDKGGINYFPRGLERLYPNTNFICIRDGNIKEIHQSDLKQYPNLVVLDLWKNHLEVLEDGLFAYNPDLVYVSLETNKICYIAPNIFDHLTKIRWLQFEENECINQKADDSLTAVEGLIKTINKNVCSCPGYTNQKLKFEILLLQFNFLDYETFRKKLEAFEIEFKTSKYSNFELFQYELQSLKEALEKRYNQILLINSTGIVEYGTCSALKSKLVQSAIYMKDLVTQGSFGAQTLIQNCNPLFDGKLGFFVNNLSKATDPLVILF